MDPIEKVLSKYSLFDSDSVKFRQPCSVLVAGPSQCGKSTLVSEMIERIGEIFTEKPARIVWVYGGNAMPPGSRRFEVMKYDQNALTELINDNPDKEARLIVFDDLRESGVFSFTPNY